MTAKMNLGRVSLVPRGEYAAGASYKRLDLVHYAGGSYVALADTQGAPPTDRACWQPLAEKGERGASGTPGKDGADGKPYAIKGPVYETLEALRQAVTDPEEGDRYEVGAQPPYDVYRYTGEAAPGDWVNEGKITGGGAEPSDDAPQPLGKASAGISDKAARADHVHEKPTAAQIGARADTWMPTAGEVGARPDTWMPTAAQVGARPDTWMPTAAQVGARPDTWTPTAEEVGARPEDWLPGLEEIGGTWKAGDTFTAEVVVLDGYVSTGTKDFVAQLCVGKPISAQEVNISKLEGLLRGVSGYLDNLTANINYLGSGYTARATIANAESGLITIGITKSSEYTHTTNNSPVSYKGMLTLIFS